MMQKPPNMTCICMIVTWKYGFTPKHKEPTLCLRTSSSPSHRAGWGSTVPRKKQTCERYSLATRRIPSSSPANHSPNCCTRSFRRTDTFVRHLGSSAPSYLFGYCSRPCLEAVVSLVRRHTARETPFCRLHVVAAAVGNA
jgi:hypothetical protein